MKDSRRSRRLERKTKRNIILTLLGIIIIFVLIIKIGIPLLANAALFISSFGSDEEVKKNSDTFIQPPVLDPLLSATNSAEIKINGKSIKSKKVELFINDTLSDDATVDENGNFKFTQQLESGENLIKARVIVDGKKSSFSDVITVIYKNSEPTLTIDTPADGDEFKKDSRSVSVTGKTDPDVSVTVNGFWAIIDEDNNYSYNLLLNNGDNEIKVIAEDEAGNKSEKTIKVKYSE